MVNEIEKILKFAGKDNVRLITKDGEHLFVVADIGNVIGAGNVRNVMKYLDEDEKGVHLVDTLGGNQRLTVVTIAGLNKIILWSNAAKKPGTVAHAFCRWVAHEVLPSIFYTGSYTVAERMANDTAHLDNKAAHHAMMDEAKAAWRLRQLARYGRTWDDER